MSTRALPALGVALALFGCATGPTITADADPTADFSRYHSYSWAYRAAPRGMNPLLYERVRQSIDRGLAARVFTQAASDDFAVGFTLGARDKVEVDDFGSYGPYYRRGWGAAYSNVEVRQYTEGTLAIDIYDTGTKQPVWHGTATDQVTPDGADQAAIDQAVDGVLAKFAPAPAPAN